MNVLIWGINDTLIDILHSIPEDRMKVLSFVIDGASPGDMFKGIPLLSPKMAQQRYAASTEYDYIFIFSEKNHNAIRRKAAELGFSPQKIAGPSAFRMLPRLQEMDDETFTAIASVPFWCHKFEISPRVTTPGIANYKPWLLDQDFLKDLSGKKILDIGAWDGPYTLEMTKRGVL